MQVIKYYQSENQAHWREEIGKGDWSAAELLHDWLESDKLKQMCGDATEVYMLTDGDKLVSFATLAPQDEIDAPELTPWIGFVYTFPEKVLFKMAQPLQKLLLISTLMKVAN